MVGSRLALAWARVYTRGMPDTARRARLDELASDLWEHADHALASDNRRSAVQLEIAGRTARGAAADLAWRFTHRSGSLAVTTLRWAGWLAFAGATALLVAFTFWSGAPVLGVYSVDDWAPGDAREFARVMSADFAGLVAGLALLARRPRAGASLVTIASAAVPLYLLWLWPVFGLLAAASSAGAIAIARRRRGSRPGSGTRPASTAKWDMPGPHPTR